MSWCWRVTMLWALALLCLAGMARADPIGISCTSQAGAGTAVSCSMNLALGTDKIDNLTFGVAVTPNGAAPALSTGRVTFTDATGDGPLVSTGSAFNQVSAVWSSLSPGMTGTVALGTVGFTIPAGATGGQTYSVTITGASGYDDKVTPNTIAPIAIGGPSMVTVPGGTLTAQTITFGALANKALGTAPFTIGATAGSGLPASFTSNTPSVCTVSGNTVTLAATGTCSITASQTGNATYAAANPVTQTFTVLPASATPLTITCGSSACPATATLLSAFTTGAYNQDLTVTGGIAPYAWSVAGGSLLPAGLALAGGLITGTPTAAGTFAFTLSAADSAGNSATQTFRITVLSVSASALARVGALSQFAPGSFWDTTIYVVNNTAAAVPVRLAIHADNGTTILPVPTALTITQQGDVQTGITATTLDRVLNPNTTLVVGAGVGQTTLAQGWVDVLSTAAVGGFAVFRYAPNGLAPNGSGYSTPWEGTVPLQTQLSVGTITLPFDNTTPSYSAAGQFTTGIAIGSLTGGTVTATFYDGNGSQLGATQTFTLGALAHTAFMVTAGPSGQSWSFTNGHQGVVKFTGPSLIGLGLRASPYGTLTTVPAVLQ